MPTTASIPRSYDWVRLIDTSSGAAALSQRVSAIHDANTQRPVARVPVPVAAVDVARLQRQSSLRFTSADLEH